MIIVIVGIILLTLLIIGIVLLIGWLTQFLKTRKDLFYRIHKERTTLCKLNNRYGKAGKHWWKIEKNIPIRLLKKDEKNRVTLSAPIGYYRGDFVGNEGNLYIAWVSRLYKRFFIFPKINLLIVNNKSVKTIRLKEEKSGEMVEKSITGLPIAEEIIQFNDREILIFAENFSDCGMFFVPVIKTAKGQPLDLVPVISSDLVDVAMARIFQGAITEWARLNKEGANVNPYATFANKVNDTSSSIEARPVVTQY